VVSDCYPSVLLPYQVVSVRGVDGRQSGDWLILHVTHTLDRSVYTQTFKLGRNATSDGASSSAIAVPAGIC
jgi:phage protein D